MRILFIYRKKNILQMTVSVSLVMPSTPATQQVAPMLTRIGGGPKPFNIHCFFQNTQVAHTECIYSNTYHQRCWLLNWKLITRWNVSHSLAWRMRRLWLPTMSNLDSSGHRKRFNFETVHFTDMTPPLDHVQTWLPFCMTEL